MTFRWCSMRSTTVSPTTTTREWQFRKPSSGWLVSLNFTLEFYGKFDSGNRPKLVSCRPKLIVSVAHYGFLVASNHAHLSFSIFTLPHRLYNQIGVAMSGTIFFLLSGGAIFMATAIFQLDLVGILIVSHTLAIYDFTRYILSWFTSTRALDTHSSVDAFQIFGSLSGNLANLFLMATATSVGFLGVFLITFCATKVSLQLVKISDIAYHSLWYKYPPQLRKKIRFFIQKAQQPKLFTGFRVTSCNLNSFTKVMKEVMERNWPEWFIWCFSLLHLVCSSWIQQFRSIWCLKISRKF